MAASSTSRSKRLVLFATCLAGMVCAPNATSAQTAPVRAAQADTRRLTDAERQAILDGNTVESATVARGEQPGSDFIDRRIHGEVGVMIGSGGSHAIYGVAEVPLGDRGAATLSFESSRFAYRR